MSLDEAIGQLEKLVTEIRRVSISDDKTSLGNALALEQEERSINAGTSEFNVIVFGDLNDFKYLNDIYGHDAGNLAINKVGETIHKIVIEELHAKAFRQSGDEFVILLKQDLVERFLSATAFFDNIMFSHKEEELRTSMSLGYTFSDGKTSFQELLERAEIACQHAKVQDDGACVEWSEDIKLNPLVRIPARCQQCGARISCNVPRHNAPTKLICCPCCGGAI
jgi:diguanylate cyclase (GGDEF)-like protein